MSRDPRSPSPRGRRRGPPRSAWEDEGLRRWPACRHAVGAFPPHPPIAAHGPLPLPSGRGAMNTGHPATSWYAATATRFPQRSGAATGHPRRRLRRRRRLHRPRRGARAGPARRLHRRPGSRPGRVRRVGRNGGQVHVGQRNDQAWLEKTVGRDDALALWRMSQDARAHLLNADRHARHRLRLSPRHDPRPPQARRRGRGRRAYRLHGKAATATTNWPWSAKTPWRTSWGRTSITAAWSTGAAATCIR
jgi:hypothetical protein